VDAFGDAVEERSNPLQGFVKLWHIDVRVPLQRGFAIGALVVPQFLPIRIKRG
jgi:hypothetical protein